MIARSGRSRQGEPQRIPRPLFRIARTISTTAGTANPSPAWCCLTDEDGLLFVGSVAVLDEEDEKARSCDDVTMVIEGHIEERIDLMPSEWNDRAGDHRASPHPPRGRRRTQRQDQR
jgi:hypothetical protein